MKLDPLIYFKIIITQIKIWENITNGSQRVNTPNVLKLLQIEMQNTPK